MNKLSIRVENFSEDCIRKGNAISVNIRQQHIARYTYPITDLVG